MHFKLCLSVALVFGTLCGFSKAQDPGDSDDPFDYPKMILLDPPKTLEEALERRNAIEADAAKELEDAESIYASKVEKANAQLIQDLKQLAKSFAAKGEIADAAKTWEEVLSVDATDTDAAEFFKAIGKPVKAPTPQKTSPARRITRREWTGDDGRTFRLTGNGTWWDSAGIETGAKTIRMADGYIIIKHPRTGTEHLILEDQYFWTAPKHRAEGKWYFISAGKWVR